jgi:hypothetical protein
MCGANKRFLFYLFLALLFASAAGALRGGEPGPWYLISEAELRSIEEYKTKSEAEKQTWLLQARGLKAQADSLRQDSRTLNDQLAQARELNRGLQRSFNEYETEQLTAISMKNGEIAGLKQTVMEKTLETEKHKGAAQSRLIIIAALAGLWIVFIAFKVRRFFRIIK